MKKIIVGVGIAAVVMIATRRLVHSANDIHDHCKPCSPRSPQQDDETNSPAQETSTSSHSCGG